MRRNARKMRTSEPALVEDSPLIAVQFAPPISTRVLIRGISIQQGIWG